MIICRREVLPGIVHGFGSWSRASPALQHRLTRNVFDSWLQRPARSPDDVVLKDKLKGLLGAG
jgi:hypothetical protein